MIRKIIGIFILIMLLIASFIPIVSTEKIINKTENVNLNFALGQIIIKTKEGIKISGIDDVNIDIRANGGIAYCPPTTYYTYDKKNIKK